MAMFTCGIPDAKACIMLASNASRQLDLLMQSSHALDPEQVVQLYIIANALESAAGLARRMPGVPTVAGI